MPTVNRYSRIIESIFVRRHVAGSQEVKFERGDIESTAAELEIALPKNMGDLIYNFRYRADLPASIAETAPGGMQWVIRPDGMAKYRFALERIVNLAPNPLMVEIKVPDATPGVIAKYILSDEQALLAKLRYNRLIDIFTGVASYSLQNHLRTNVPGIGQIETDEVYLGIDRRGAHYVFPVQAKGRKDRLNIVQIGQDIALCSRRFPNLICRPIGAQFLQNDVIVLFELEETEEGVRIVLEKHYRLVPPKEVTDEDLERYRLRGDGGV